MIKNLKINQRRIKAGIGAFILTSTMFLTGCKQNTTDGVVTEEGTLQYVFADNKMISLSDLRLKDKETNNIIENIDAVLVGNKLEREVDLISIIFDSSVESILIGDELVPVDRLVLINTKTNQELNAIDYALINDELVSMEDRINDNMDINSNGENEELTTKKFYELVDAVFKKYSEIGLDVSREDVIDYLLFANIDKIATDNKELIDEIIGEREVDVVYSNSADVRSAIMTENNFRYCSKGLGWDSLILVSDTIFDKEERKVVENIEARIKEVVEAKGNKTEFNELFGKLLKDMLFATNEEFNMESGAGYHVMMILVNFVRVNHQSLLNAENAELVKYFVNFATDAVEYQENSRATAYYRGIYNILTDCPTKTKTK